MHITTHFPEETKKLAELFARELLKSNFNRKGALVVALEGDLGGGKTTFVKGFARGLGIHEKILSPTFVIMKRFKIHDSRFKNFVHIDAYRLNSVRELRVLGWQDILKDKGNMVLVEWADRIRGALLKEYICIQFEFIDEKMRRLKLSVKRKMQSAKQQSKA